MIKPAMWRDTAAFLRVRAGQADDAEKERVLLVFAADCDELAADLEAGR